MLRFIVSYGGPITLAEPPRAMRGTRRAGAHWRTAQPLTRLDGGGYPGPFWVGVFVAVTAVGVKY